MTKKELAMKLNGRTMGSNFLDVRQEAKDSGLVIVYGESDDLMEFEGAMYDEVDCFEGGKVYLDANGVNQDGEKLEHWINAVWDRGMTRDNRPAFWTYQTDLPCERFDILEDDSVFCEGIVFSMDDLKEECGKEIQEEISSTLFEDISEGKTDFVISKATGDIKIGSDITLTSKNRRLAKEVRYIVRHKDLPTGIKEGYCVIGLS